MRETAPVCGFVVASGIAGLDDARWQASLRSIACRGPDDDQEWSLDGLRVGHRRLAIIGSALGGRQPIVTARHVLVFNGEIYNYQELAQDLNISAESDTQVLFEIVQRDLQVWLPRLRGMYSFVHIDRESGEITAARDPFGIKPLYWTQTSDGGLALASTAGALNLLLGDSKPDPVALAGFLGWGFFASGRSAFAGIQKAAPASVHVWAPEGQRNRKQREWSPRFGNWPHMSVDAAIGNSVEAHLVADVPVGVLLSGGVDSTLLAAIASRSVGELRTFSLTNPLNSKLDEGPIARRNARLIGSVHTEIPVSPSLLARQIDILLRTSGEPFADAAYLPLSALCEAVSQEVKVALAGEGADEIFGGYRRYDVERYFDTRFYRQFVLPAAMRLPLKSPTRTRFAGVGRALAASGLATAWERHASLTYASWPIVSRFFPEATKSAMRESQDTWQSLRADTWGKHLPAHQAFDLRVYLPNTYLEKSDRASMAHSLELRTPYLDPVVALAARDEPWKNSTKPALRRALSHQLPGVQLPKQKKGLSVDLAALTPELREPLHFMFTSRESVLRQMGLKDASGLQEACRGDLPLQFRVAILGAWQQICL